MAIDINKILDEARALGCSDLHFTVGIPPIVRQGGNLRKLSSYPDMTRSKFSKYARICAQISSVSLSKTILIPTLHMYLQEVSVTV